MTACVPQSNEPEGLHESGVEDDVESVCTDEGSTISDCDCEDDDDSLADCPRDPS